MVLRLSVLFLLLVLTGAAAFWAAYFLFYRGSVYDPPPTVDVPLRQPLTPGVSLRDTPEVSPLRVEQGTLLVDALHANGFQPEELLALEERVVERGYVVETVGNFEPIALGSRLTALEAGLRGADSLLVVGPGVPYSADEVTLVKRFVDKGGKVLLVADPGRAHRSNSLADAFGLKFQPDYLYNQVEHDLNFQNILVRDFRPDEVTSGLTAVTLYGAGSIESSGFGLAFGDENTLSSLVDAVGPVSPIARGDRRNVLAIADITFMVPPHDALLDNGRLLSNIADFLTTSERSYTLADFPHFFGGDLEVLVGQPSLVGSGLWLKNILEDYGLAATITDVEDVSRDTVFLGLYDDVLQVEQYLQNAGVRIDDALGTPFAPELGLAGTAVTVLEENQGRQVLLVLADTPATLETAVSRLAEGEFRADLLSDHIAVAGPLRASEHAQPGPAARGALAESGPFVSVGR